MLKKQIPNLITLTNLLCGTLAILAVLQFSNPMLASLFILLGAIFDFFDGMVARLLKVSSKMGLELDSLADVVSFGVAPAMIAFQIVQQNIENGWDIGFATAAMPFLTLTIPVFSAYRLAKFNLDERQTTSFLGLPTPMNAFFWLSLPLISFWSKHSDAFWGLPLHDFYAAVAQCLTNPWFVIIAACGLSVLLVTELPLFALKFKSANAKENRLPFAFLGISAVLILLFSVVSIPFIVLLYILLSIIFNTRKR